ncbi:hypothetical protein DSCW_08720 [Desulfosarcina widdelii]|uniref:Uncharacterized protein n=1 Tax=Desulfosarcina widdelii TaxID=947919 RepID=A0A5K7YYF5_9BACT|nr:DUF935 family protein [Desulfosarcina widdelii]BBO73455.1 hypothetical protein DSCW_08720 [Desulfosarcina widdelii]
MKLYISPTESVEIDDNREMLTTDIATRSRSMDWWGMFGYLPDPDPVLAKLGLGLEVYRELLSDAHVWSCYDSRKSGALSCEWEIRAGGDSPADKRALKIAEESLANLDIYQAIMEMLDAPFYGLSPLEITWSYKGRQWMPAKLEGKPPEWFVFDDENRMRFLSASEMINGELLPQPKPSASPSGLGWFGSAGGRSLVENPLPAQRLGLQVPGVFHQPARAEGHGQVRSGSRAR